MTNLINLLPQKEKEELIQERRWRLTLILGILFLLFLICLFLILFLVDISIKETLTLQKIFLEQKERETRQTQGVEKEIKNLNLTLSRLESFYQDQIDFPGVFSRISKLLPEGVYLTSLNLVSSQFSVCGFSPTRQKLLQLKQKLEDEEFFTDIYFPPSNWIPAVNINFSVNLRLNGNKK